MNQLIFNQRLIKNKASLIRSILDTEHTGTYSRINLGLGELAFSMPQKAQDANASALASEKNHYTPNVGLLELRKKIAADFFSRQHVSLTEKNVVVTFGSTGALFITFATLLNPGDEVLIPALHYPLYESVPQIFGAQVIEYALHENFAIDNEDLVEKITPKTKLIVLNSPSNPTGQAQSIETLKRLAKVTSKFSSLFFLSDEIYSTCLFGDTQHTSIARFIDNVIVVDGLSKRASMTGKRLGWLIGPEPFIEQAIKMQQYAYTCAPSDSQYAALPVLSGACDSELVQFQKSLEKNRGVVLDALTTVPHITFIKPQGAFYCLVDISHFETSRKVAKKLIQEVNVVTVPGFAFGKAGDKYLRLSFAGKKKEIIEGIERMKGVFKKWQ